MAEAAIERTVVCRGDVVQIIKTGLLFSGPIVEKECSTVDFIAECGKDFPSDSGVLPPGCIYHARNVNVEVLTIERPAQVQEILWHNAESAQDDVPADKIHKLALGWPVTQWTLAFSPQGALLGLYISATLAPLSNMDDQIYELPMPNQYVDGRFCLGNFTLRTSTARNTKALKTIERALTAAWNTDLRPSFENVGVESLLDWHAKTDKETFGETLTYKPHEYATFAGLVKHILVGGR